MTNHWYAIKMEPGETVGHFLEQFKNYPIDNVIAWDALGGVFEGAVKDTDGRTIVRLPIRAHVHAKLPIDRPCSACSGGDPEMKYHDHTPPFRKETHV